MNTKHQIINDWPHRMALNHLNFGPSALGRCCGKKCPLLMAFFSLSPDVTFLPEGVIVGFRNFAWSFNSQKIKFGVRENGGK
jgi:hypothetical protein